MRIIQICHLALRPRASFDTAATHKRGAVERMVRDIPPPVLLLGRETARWRRKPQVKWGARASRLWIAFFERSGGGGGADIFFFFFKMNVHVFCQLSECITSESQTHFFTFFLFLCSAPLGLAIYYNVESGTPAQFFHCEFLSMRPPVNIARFVFCVFRINWLWWECVFFPSIISSPTPLFIVLSFFYSKHTMSNFSDLNRVLFITFSQVSLIYVHAMFLYSNSFFLMTCVFVKPHMSKICHIA